MRKLSITVKEMRKELSYVINHVEHLSIKDVRYRYYKLIKPKKMKLELKIEYLAPYLPYGLKLKSWHKDNEYHIMTMCDKSGLSNLSISEVIDNQDEHYNYKPILRPLSDLTKEIASSEHRNYKFIEVLQLHNNVKIDSNGVVTDGKDEYGIHWLAYESMQLLLKWHFDVFGLIEKGLAININNLKDENN